MVRSLTPGMALWLTVSADNQIELDQENRKSSAEFYQCFEPAALATGLITKEQQEIRQNGIESKAKILHVVPKGSFASETIEVNLHLQLTLLDGCQYNPFNEKISTRNFTTYST